MKIEREKKPKMRENSKAGKLVFFTFYFSLFTLLSPSVWGGEPSDAERGELSVRKAFFLSLLLPGAGEFYAGDIKSAKSFLEAEALIWAAHLGFKEYGRWRRHDYRTFARLHAGINPTGKPDTYFDDIKFYGSSYRYNEVAFREDGPKANLYSSDAAWEWDSQDSRERYRLLRNSSLLSYRYATYMIGAAVVNRIVSAIDAARIVRKSKQPAGTAKSNSRIELSCSPLPPSLIILRFRW